MAANLNRLAVKGLTALYKNHWILLQETDICSLAFDHWLQENQWLLYPYFSLPCSILRPGAERVRWRDKLQRFVHANRVETSSFTMISSVIGQQNSGGSFPVLPPELGRAMWQDLSALQVLQACCTMRLLKILGIITVAVGFHQESNARRRWDSQLSQLYKNLQ